MSATNPNSTIAILEPGYANYDAETKILGPCGADVVPIPAENNPVQGLQALNPVAIMVRDTKPIGEPEIDACPSLKVIARYGVGVDTVDLDYARNRGIYVANVPDYGAEIEVSEHALALYLSVQRRIPSRHQEVLDGEWGVAQDAPIPGRQNATLGLIGCGRIGLEAARKFKPFGFSEVLVYDPFLPEETAKANGLQQVDLVTLCSQADVVSLHAPLTDSTRNIVNADLIGRMKTSSIIVNVSRGGLIDELALAEALHEGRLYGAGIDVFEEEPVKSDHPLLQTPNTVVTDHTAWYSERSVEVLQKKAAQEVRRVLEGETPLSWVNPW